MNRFDLINILNKLEELKVLNNYSSSEIMNRFDKLYNDKGDKKNE